MRKAGIFLTLLLAMTPLFATIACDGQEVVGRYTVLPWAGDEIVRTGYGAVEGFEDKSDTLVWKAIPYAKPPVDELRWKAPRDPEPWRVTRIETEFCSECPQYNYTGSITGIEDCLYLNVWRPDTEETGLPVYFWIHGGGNSGGSASEEGYDGANLASKSNLVVVSVNYRLGPMGWFTHPALRSGESGQEKDDSGNYGTLDLIKALEWVRDNIEAFGGDPENVTIAGESAGAINVFSLMISPLAGGLFHKAIAQSGMPVSSAISDGEASARDVLIHLLINDEKAADEEAARKYLDGMSNAQIEDYLRSKSAAEFLESYDTASFGMIAFPYIFEDGVVIPGDGFDVFDTGNYANKVPLIIGTNKEETKLFLFLEPTFRGNDELYQTVASYSSDMWKAMGVDEVARKLSSLTDQPDVYAYQFLWGSGGDVGESVIPGPWGFKLGAFHGLDIPFFFGNDDFFGPLSSFVFTDENRRGREALSDAIMAYAGQFVRTGNPNRPGSDLPQWEPWSNGDGEPKCIMWDADEDVLDIKMSSVELNAADVRESMESAIPESLFSQVLHFLLEFTDWE